MALANALDIPVFLRLVRDLLRIRASGAATEDRARLLSSGIEDMLASAEWQRFAPLVLFLLEEHPKGSWPLARELEWRVRREAARVAAADMVRQQLIELLGERLRASQVSLILLKAAALSGWAYPASAPRLGFDLDLLVRPEDKDRLRAALSGLAEERDKFPGKPHLASLAYEWDFRTRPPVPIDLDVHRALCYPALYPIDYPAFWARSRPHPAYGVEELRVPSPEDALLHMALHALHDLRNWSRQDVDAALLLRAEAVEWDVLIARARSWGLAAAAYFLLERAARGLSLPVPETVLDRLRPGPPLLRIGRWVLRGEPPRGHWTERSARRLRQLVSQVAMSGSPWLAVRFQLDYGRARLADAIEGHIWPGR